MKNTQFAVEGARFKEARIALGVTQKELAEMTGISLPTIKHYEQGVRIPKIAYSRMLEDASVNMKYVLHGVGEPLLNKQSAIPIQQSRSPALQIEESPANYDLGQPKAKPQNGSSSHEMAEMRAKMEVLAMQAELARKEAKVANERAETARVQAEAAKERARAEIAEAKLEILQPQMEDFRHVVDIFKRTEARLAQAEAALGKLQQELEQHNEQHKKKGIA